MMYHASRNYILNTISNGSYVGIVYFSSTARTVLPMTAIISQADRERVTLFLPTKANGATAIASGMKVAMTVSNVRVRTTWCFNKNVPVWLLGTTFEARNFICEPGPHEL
jgi:hypothetical protein